MGRQEIEAVSGIFGAISIACWVVVFSPQIIQNFRRKNADALSLHFILIWLVGDIFNIVGSILQGVLTSMIILAIYYTVADLVLLGQMFFYRGFSLRDVPCPPSVTDGDTNEDGGLDNNVQSRTELIVEKRDEKSDSDSSDQVNDSSRSDCSDEVASMSHPGPSAPAISPVMKDLALNVVIVLAVGTAGFVGWLISKKVTGNKAKGEHEGGDDLEFDIPGQVFGYLSAATYIASRIPQLLLNWRRKATEGLSMLFFTFAFLGNTTYIISILAYDPRCEHNMCRPGEAASLYKRYLLINFSWLAGSFVNLIQDFGVFTQYFIYRNNTCS
ncbi:PQ loop repeat-domain-containing protein [Mariannaea sp. PMI_226]|nr:PQ loop repeat-domain-containing protein [Mariannaea sp. PMI_226]